MDYSKYSILIVDDVPVNLMIIEKLLTNYHFNILKANNGQSALDIVANSHPDLVLLDIMMPGIDGFETLTRLRNNPDLPNNIPVILMSALNSDADVKKGLSLGANDYLTKPVIKEQLDNCIKNHLRPKTTQNNAATTQQEPTTGIDLNTMLRSYLFCSRHTENKQLLKQIVLSVPTAWIEEELFCILYEKDNTIVRQRMLQWFTDKVRNYTADFKVIDVYPVMLKTIESLKPALVERNLSVDISSACQDIKVKTSPDLLGSIIQSLLVGLCRICGEGSIRIDKEVRDQSALILTMSGEHPTEETDIELCIVLAKELATKINGSLTVQSENGHIVCRLALLRNTL